MATPLEARPRAGRSARDGEPGGREISMAAGFCSSGRLISAPTFMRHMYRRKPWARIGQFRDLMVSDWWAWGG